MARGTMRTTARRPTGGTSKKLSGSNEVKPFRNNESSDPYYDPQWDNPYQRESTPVNEDPKRKADRERQQRIDEKDWDSLTKKRSQEDFNIDLSGSVGFSHEIANIGGDSISFTAGVDFIPGPDLKIKDGKATVGVGVGLSRIHSVSGGLVIDLATREITGISGGLAAFGLGIEFSSEKCHTTVTITIGGIGISYGKDTCKNEREEEPPPKKQREPKTEPPEPDPNQPPPGTNRQTGGGPSITIPDMGEGVYVFSWRSQASHTYTGQKPAYSRGYIMGGKIWKNQYGNIAWQVQASIYSYDSALNPKDRHSVRLLGGLSAEYNSPYASVSSEPDGTGIRLSRIWHFKQVLLNGRINPRYYRWQPILAELGPSQDFPYAPYHRNDMAYHLPHDDVGVEWGSTRISFFLLKGTAEEIQEEFLKYLINTQYSQVSTSSDGLTNTFYEWRIEYDKFIDLDPPKTKYFQPILITPDKNTMCDLSPVMSLQRKANEMISQNTEIINQSAAAIGVGAFPATYPGSLTTNKGTKQVKNLAEQVDTIYDSIDELMGKYPQKHKIKKGKQEFDIEIPNQSEGQAELIGMMMQSLQQTTMSNNMENRQLQELALTRQMVIKLYYMVESIMEYLDYPTETSVVNVPMSITPLKRKGRNIEKLKEFGDMVKESVQPVIVTKKKTGDPETLKKYLLHLSHGAAVIKAAFWRKLSPENPKEQINKNLAQQEKLSELSSTEKAWNEALDAMAGKLDPENEAEAKKNAPKIQVEKKKPGAK